MKALLLKFTNDDTYYYWYAFGIYWYAFVINCYHKWKYVSGFCFAGWKEISSKTHDVLCFFKSIVKQEKKVLQTWGIEFKHSIYALLTRDPSGFYCRQCISFLARKQNDRGRLGIKSTFIVRFWILHKRTLTKQRCGIVLRITMFRVAGMHNNQRGGRRYRIQLFLHQLMGCIQL